jgi:hypothetical protein
MSAKNGIDLPQTCNPARRQGGTCMKNESFIQLFIEFDPSEFQGAVLWLPEASLSRAVSESEVVYVG